MFEQKVDHFNVNYEMNIRISFQFYHNNNRMQYRLLQFGKEKQTNWKNNERKENKIISLLLLVLYISHFIFIISYFSFYFLILYFSFYFSPFIFLMFFFSFYIFHFIFFLVLFLLLF